MPEIGPAAKRVGRHRTRSRSAWLTVCCKEKFSTSLTGNVWAQMPRPAKVRLDAFLPSVSRRALHSDPRLEHAQYNSFPPRGQEEEPDCIADLTGAMHIWAPDASALERLTGEARISALCKHF